jgi:eukaryotic-like serine/threonine-protein kinase
VSLAPGTSIGRYRIVAALGAGGMGEVYRALDTRLKREVALKVLPPDLVTDPDRRRRFLLEAQSVAALSHPRIVTVYDADDTDGVCYLALELVAGAPLTERLRSGPVPVLEALGLAVDVSEGLACAHAKGIVHRDLKPANVLVDTEGHARLIDFGVAKLLEPGSGEATTDLATRAGRVVGTPAYMAPEQARGAAVDARADVFSFGVLLYELLTGRRPFDRGSWPDTVAAVLRDPVPSLAGGTPGLGGDACAALQRLLDGCLAKEKTARPASMAAVLVELEAIRRLVERGSHGPDAAPPEEASIVVLPFENLSPDPDNAFFADGLTEEVIADLSKIRSLRVISRTSAMHYKGTTRPLPEIAAELRVRYVLEGSVRRAGNSLRITAQLIDAATDAHLWAEKYSGTFDDVFDVQERLSRRIVDALRLTLTPAETRGLSAHSMTNAAAYECYLRAMHEANLWTEDGLTRAETHLKHGVELIGEHPVLLAGLAYVLAQYVNLGFAQDDALAKGLACGERALALDPSNPQAHAALGVLVMFQATPSPSRSIGHFRQAVAGAPGDMASTTWLYWIYIYYGKTRSAAPLVERMLGMDPVNPMARFARALAPFMEGRFEEAVEQCAALYKMAPEASMHVLWYALALAYAGRGRESQDVLSTLPGEPGDDAMARLAVMLKCALSGDRAGLARLLTPQFEITARRDSQYSLHVAAFYARLGEQELALKWLTNAVDRGFGNPQFIETVDPFLASVRGDPRFPGLIDRARQIQSSIED